MNKLKIIIITLLILLAINIFSNFNSDLELDEYSGNLKQIADNWYFKSGEKIIELSLAPVDFFEKKEIELSSNIELSISGKMDNDVFVVYSLKIAENVINLRDENAKPLWEIKKYEVIPKKCIGCRLCVPACPQGAITMVKGIAVIDPEKCDGDGTCVIGDGKRYKGCPVAAIKIRE